MTDYKHVFQWKLEVVFFGIFAMYFLHGKQGLQNYYNYLRSKNNVKGALLLSVP